MIPSMKTSIVFCALVFAFKACGIHSKAAKTGAHMNAAECFLQRLQQQAAQVRACFNSNVDSVFFRHIPQLILHGNFAV